MEKIWLGSYPDGVPETIDVDEYASIVALFDESTKKFAGRNAYECMGSSLTYASLSDKVEQFAAYLQNELHLKRGDRVALMMPNILQYPVAMFGVLKAGCAVVNVNPLYTARELEHQLKDSGVDTIVIIENFASTLETALQHITVKNIVVVSLGDMLGLLRGWVVNFVVRYVRKMVKPWRLPSYIRFNDALRKGAQGKTTPIDLNHNDVAFLQYTGGTTGPSKGAVLTHGNIVANLQQAHAWIRLALDTDNQLIVTALPLYHIFSLTANCLTFLKVGANNLLIPNPRDIPGLIKEMSKYPFTAITGVNTLFNALVNHPDFAHLNFSTLKVALAGGMAMQQAVAERWAKVTGIPILEAYGMTETSPAVSINPLDLKAFNQSIGLPISSTDITLRNDDGEEVGIGERGELCVKGPQVMREYWNRPEESTRAFTHDGYFRTGDIATISDKGFLRIVDRKKDMIVVSGFNVFPNEVEDVVASHPDVAEVAVVGVPDDKTGEAVKLFAVLRNPSLTREDLIAYCRKNLTGYKVPHLIEFRDELPKSNVGKILRRTLKEEQ